MPFLVDPQTGQIVCETPEDAAAMSDFIIQRMNQLPPKQRVRERVAERREHRNGHKSSLRDVWASLPDEAKQVAVALRDSQQPLGTDELCSNSEVEPTRLKYAIRGLRTAGKRLGIDPNEMAESYIDERDRKTRYRMSTETREMLKGME